MKRFYIRLVSFLVLTATIFTLSFHSGSSSHAQGNQMPINWDEWDVIPGRVLIKYQPIKSARLRTSASAAGISGLSLAPIESAIRRRYALANGGTDVGFKSILPDTFIGDFDPTQRDRILKLLASDPEVVYFEPDRKRIPVNTWGTRTPNDPLRASLWGMDRIGAPAAWARQSAIRAAVRVAIMEDDRFDNSHHDLSAQNSTVLNHTGVVGDHATQVAGIIAATGNNNQDVVGIANVEIVSLDTGTHGAGFAQQISWAVNNEVRVINMSFKWCGDDGIPGNGDDCASGHCGYAASSTTEQDAIYSVQLQTVFVAAASNDSCNTDFQGRRPIPAGYQNVLAASAIDQSDNLATFSNFGPYVDFAAPGVNVQSTATGNTVVYADGTSFASPHVAGTVAAILAIRPNFDIRSISALLDLTAEDIGVVGRDDNFGAGVVRADRAIAGLADVYAHSGCINPPNPGPLIYAFCNLTDALNNTPNNGLLGIVKGSSFAGPRTITKPVTIVAVGGTVVIGP